jgi:pimeloyl-ACP methyl ester carboxylesterase
VNGSADSRASGWWGNPVAEFAWPLEVARLLASPVYRGAGVPQGDGSTVLVIPGFASSDASARLLRRWLARIGYSVRCSRTVVNLDCSDRLFDHLGRRLVSISAETGQQLSLVGHSRGGQLARALAARYPERVSRVIVLGSGLNDPYAISIPLNAVVSTVRRYHHTVTDRGGRRGCLTRECRCSYNSSFTAEFPKVVQLTSIRAARDGVVRREACIVAGATNIEVDTTHTGLAFNPEAYRAIALALAAGRDGQPRT